MPLVIPCRLLRKGGGPFIGPKGGKWADPQHTIAWHEGSGVSALDRQLAALPKYRDFEEWVHERSLGSADYDERTKLANALHLSTIEKNAIVEWSEDSASMRLRSVKPDRTAQTLQSAIIKAGKQPGRKSVTLYRGMAISKDALAKLLSSRVFKDDAISSWSVSGYSAKYFAEATSKAKPQRIVFRVKTSKGLHMPKKLQTTLAKIDELETILPKSEFRIISKKAIGGKRISCVVVDLEEMGD